MNGPFEIRPDDEGQLDEVVAKEPAFVHLERMSTSGWWLGITMKDGAEIHVHLGAKRASVDGYASVER